MKQAIDLFGGDPLGNNGLVSREVAQEGALILQLTYPRAHCELNFSNAFQLLTATILSAQTTDERVNQVTPELFSRWGSAAELAGAPLGDLEEVLRPLGMFRRRADMLKRLGGQLADGFAGQVPGTREELVSLPGVGRKTAHVVLGNWFGAQEITVDTHVSRVTNRLGWADAKTPLAIERQLRDLLPDAPWTQLCHELIFHGRRICHARKPLCEECPLLDLCPWGQRAL